MYPQMNEVLARARCAERGRVWQGRVKSRSSLRIMLDAAQERQRDAHRMRQGSSVG